MHTFINISYKSSPFNIIPKMLRGKIIIMGDSTFLKAVASNKDEKNNPYVDTTANFQIVY